MAALGVSERREAGGSLRREFRQVGKGTLCYTHVPTVRLG